MWRACWRIILRRRQIGARRAALHRQRRASNRTAHYLTQGAAAFDSRATETPTAAHAATKIRCMKVLGIDLRAPSFNQLTSATVFGVGLWLACIGVLSATGHALGRQEAGAALLVFVWGAIGVPAGVHIGKGARHLAVNLFVSGVLLALYEGAWMLAA